MHARTILLVDDNPHDIELALAAFEAGGLTENVAVARGGTEALDYLRSEGAHAKREAGQPTVVLLDLKMPHMDGLAVLHAIKDDPRLQGIPVVMLSTSREQADIESCYWGGASAYVVKPVDFVQFVEAVRTIGVFWALLNEHPPGS